MCCISSLYRTCRNKDLQWARVCPSWTRHNNIAEDNEDIRTIIEKFDKYIIGETNETYERYVFNKREQKPEESVELYISALKDLIQSCNYTVTV